MVKMKDAIHKNGARLQSPAAIAVAAGALAGGALVGAAGYVTRRLTAPGRARLPLRLGFTPFETGVAWEDVTFPGGDGAPLGGWLLPRDAPAPSILACGGYRGRRSDLLGIGSHLWRAGFTVLLFDYAGYGDVPGPVTLGHRELADARAALRFLRQRHPGAPLGVIGYSMGAAVAIMLAAREPDVRAVVADSPFASQRDIVRYQMARELGLRPTAAGEPIARALLWLIDHTLRRRYGFRFADVEPLRDVGRLAARPLLLVHGEADHMIPVEHARRVDAAARAGGVALESWYVPSAGHCEAYFLDREGYCRRVRRFFAQQLDAGLAASLVVEDAEGEWCDERDCGTRYAALQTRTWNAKDQP
jgi:dipeptidyl aminopeptidase/acylaminoacyl peptidase